MSTTTLTDETIARDPTRTNCTSSVLDSETDPRLEKATRRPLALSDDQLDVVRRGAQSLHPRDRSQYLQTVASLLTDCEVGDGSVARAVAAAQRQHRIPPDLSRGNHVPRWGRKGGGIRDKANGGGLGQTGP
jgi:hypothetical protein